MRRRQAQSEAQRVFHRRPAAVQPPTPARSPRSKAPAQPAARPRPRRPPPAWRDARPEPGSSPAPSCPQPARSSSSIAPRALPSAAAAIDSAKKPKTGNRYSGASIRGRASTSERTWSIGNEQVIGDRVVAAGSAQAARVPGIEDLELGLRQRHHPQARASSHVRLRIIEHAPGEQPLASGRSRCRTTSGRRPAAPPSTTTALPRGAHTPAATVARIAEDLRGALLGKVGRRAGCWWRRSTRTSPPTRPRARSSRRPPAWSPARLRARRARRARRRASAQSRAARRRSACGSARSRSVVAASSRASVEACSVSPSSSRSTDVGVGAADGRGIATSLCRYKNLTGTAV